MVSIVQQQYERLAGIYDQRWQFYIVNTLSFLLDWCQINPGESILDIACGTGEFERLLIERWHNNADNALSSPPSIVGIDFSPAMLAIAQRKLAASESVRFHQGSATDLPWPTACFDLIICANAFHYFDPPHQVLREMGRVLNSGGRIVILDWCRDFLICQWCDWLLGWVDPGHQQCYTEAELHGLLRAAGFQIERSQRVRFGLIWGLMAVEVKLAQIQDQ